MTNEQKLLIIENITALIVEFDKASGGQFRQAEDREAYDIISRIERRMMERLSKAVDTPRPPVAEDGLGASGPSQTGAIKL
jgi:hypothetical protein